MVVSVDGLLERLGSRYQLLVFIVLTSCLKHVALNHHLHQHYLATPPHHCKLPEGWDEALALPTVLVSGTKYPGSPRVGYSRCEMYIDQHMHRKGTKPCVHGYMFTLQGKEWSIVAEWGLVCERIFIKHWVMTSYLVGLVIGGLVFGFLSDRFGRRNLLVVSVATVSGLGLALHFVRRLIVFLSLRFIQAVFVQGIYVTSWTLVGELWPPRWRCKGLVAASMARPLGIAMGALVAIFVQHWRAMQLAVSLPLFISLMYCWLVPESLRWLLTRGKTRRARLVAAQLARHNKLVLPPTVHAQLDHLAAHVYQDVPWGSLVTLFKTPRLRKHTFIVVYIWLAVSLSDSLFREDLPLFGKGSLAFSGSALGQRSDLGSLLSAGVEAGAVILAAVLTTQFYRRAYLVIHLMLSAALAISVICVRQLVKDVWLDVEALATALKFLGLLIVGGARVGVGVVSVEVVPTTARASAIGLCAAHAAVGEILTPFLSLVGEMSYPSVPWLISAAGCLSAAILALLLPETSGTSLPDVVDEAEVVGLCCRGDVIKACDVGYGRSPYWVEVDGLIVSRSVSDAGADEEDKFRSLRRNLDSQLVPKITEPHDKKVCKLAHGAGPSQMMVLPHVRTRRRRLSCGFSRAFGSLGSTCSQCSMVSLVDVSRVNGNNSDTTDSNYSDERSENAQLSETKDDTKTAENMEIKEESNIVKTVHKEDGKQNLPKRTEFESSDSTSENPVCSPTSSSSAVESDVSISVCSLQIKHIRRPNSPTDTRLSSVERGESSSSSDVFSVHKSGKTHLHEYLLRNSYTTEEDFTNLSFHTELCLRGDSSQETGSTNLSSNIANKEDSLNAQSRKNPSVRSDQEQRKNAIDRSAKSFSGPTTSGCFPSSKTTPEELEKKLLVGLDTIKKASFTPNNLSLNSSLEYDVSRGGSEIVAHALSEDSLESSTLDTRIRMKSSLGIKREVSPTPQKQTDYVTEIKEAQSITHPTSKKASHKTANEREADRPSKPKRNSRVTSTSAKLKRWESTTFHKKELSTFKTAVGITDIDETNL